MEAIYIFHIWLSFYARIVVLDLLVIEYFLADCGPAFQGHSMRLIATSGQWSVVSDRWSVVGSW